MIHHTSISITNFERSLTFYDNTFSKLMYDRVMTMPEMRLAAYGIEGGSPAFWISEMGNPEEQIGNAHGVHFGFLAPNEECVDAWYKACLEHGGTNNGAPGQRPEYHHGYYGAFIIDPDGWRIEACFHGYRAKE